MKVKSLSRARLLATPWTAAYQAPPPMGFSRQEYWSGGAIAFSIQSSRDRKSENQYHWNKLKVHHGSASLEVSTGESFPYLFVVVIAQLIYFNWTEKNEYHLQYLKINCLWMRVVFTVHWGLQDVESYYSRKFTTAQNEDCWNRTAGRGGPVVSPFSLATITLSFRWLREFQIFFRHH